MADEFSREVIAVVAYELAKYEQEVGFSRLKAGVAAEVAVRAALPLIRAAVVDECVQAIEAEGARRSMQYNPEIHFENVQGWYAAAALVRALVSPLEGDRT